MPGIDTDFGRSLLTQMAIAAVFALSFNLLFGQTGLLSFGHAVYFGLGGYAAIHVMRAINQGLPLPMVLVPLAGAAGGLLGAWRALQRATIGDDLWRSLCRRADPGGVVLPGLSARKASRPAARACCITA
jgi:hypothetical protein